MVLQLVLYLRALLRRVPLGYKTFPTFQKGGSPAQNLKPPVPFPTPIKWKEYSNGPLGSYIRSLPPGG